MPPLLKVVLIVAAALAATAGIVWYLIWAQSALGDVELGFHGWIALVLGVVVTLGLGLGLMRLVYVSNRRGYDERVAKHPEGPFERPDLDR